MVPSLSLISILVSWMALGETGQCSSHTMQGFPNFQGMQRLRSIQAEPILILFLASISSSWMAPVGQTCVHREQ